LKWDFPWFGYVCQKCMIVDFSTAYIGPPNYVLNAIECREH
jgi:hypothetical protein